MVAAALNAVCMPGDLLLARDIPDMPWYPAVMSAVVAVGLIVLLLVRRQRVTVRLGSSVFLINTATILVALWITSRYWASAGRPWTPFQANKLGALAVPLLAPELGVGLVAIAGFAATAIGRFYFLDPDIQRGLPVGEPWTVLPYALFGGVLLVYRLRGLSLEREMLRLHAEAAAAEQQARVLLRLRDYANTPIQTIAFTARLIRQRSPDLGALVDRLERAAGRLTKLSRALTRYQSKHKGSANDESPDSRVSVPGSRFPVRVPGSERSSEPRTTNGESEAREPGTSHLVNRIPDL
jgi:hypothetical protein